MEPITGSEDRRSDDRDETLFAQRVPEPPAFPPVAPGPAGAGSATGAPDHAVLERIAALDQRAAAMQNRLEEVARALGLLGRRLQEHTPAMPGAAPSPAAGDERLQAIERRLTELPGLDELPRFESIEQLLRQLPTRDELAALDTIAEQVRQLGAAQERQLALVDGLSAALDAEGASLRMDQERVAAMLTSLRDELSDGPPAPQSAAWGDVLIRVEGALSAQANRIETGLNMLRESVTEQLGAQQSDLAGTAAGVIEAVATVRDLTADRLQAVTEMVDDTSTRITAQLISGDAAASDQLDQVRTSVAGVTAPLEELAARTEALAAAAAGSTSALEDSRVRLEGVERTMQQLREAMDGFEAVIEHRLAEAAGGALTDVRGELRTARESLDAAADAAGEQVRAAVEDVRTRLEAVVTASQQVAAERAQQTLDQAAQQLREVTDSADETATRLQSFEEVLVALLAEHDQALADQRAQLVYDLVSSLADGLTKRERKRLAQRIDVPPAPQTADMSRRLREVFEMAANRDLTGLPRDEEEPEAEIPMPKRVVRARGPLADIIDESEDEDAEEFVDDEPPIDADLRTLLGEMKGLPDATRERLVAEFGSLARLQAADDETVLSVRGVGPALLGRLRKL